MSQSKHSYQRKKEEKKIANLNTHMWIKFSAYNCHPNNFSIALAIALNLSLLNE